MIIKLILAIAILFAAVWLKNKYLQLPPKEKKNAVLKVILISLAGILIIGTLTGRMHPIGALFALIIPFAKVGISTVYKYFPMWLSHTGGIASFTTEHLNAKVNIPKRSITGIVIKGDFKDKTLASLSEEQITQLEVNYKAVDLKSYYLIRLCRRDEFSNSDSQPPPQCFSQPSREEALQILGLNASPTKEEISLAYKRLINKVHPDKGGNDFLASRINQAKDILIEQLKDNGS